MDTRILKDAFKWGFLLWLAVYVLGVILFAVVPQSLIGWVILPFGLLLTLWVLATKVNGKDMRYYFKLAVIWTVMAVVLDYLMIVKLLKPSDGYYKPDVYLYYTLTFLMPLIAGNLKLKRGS